MAVLDSNSSPLKVVSSKSTQESLKRARSGDNEREPKRAKCHGVRIIGNHIYDSVNGNTCHQCRQKTRNFVASCKNQKGCKVCPIKFCHKCLLNRYGEKAEEVGLLSDWKCPKCRDICNCSLCMKKKGCKPTGQLVITAKASGFSSVHAMLKGKDSENANVNQINRGDGQDPGKHVALSSMQLHATDKEQLVSPLVKHEKENLLHGKSDVSARPWKAKVDCKEKVKRLELKELSYCAKDDEPYLTRSSAEQIDEKEVREGADRNENEKNKKLALSTKSGMRNAGKLAFNKNAKDVTISLTKEVGARDVAKQRKETSLCGKDDPIQTQNVLAEPNGENSSCVKSNLTWQEKVSASILASEDSSLSSMTANVKEEIDGGTCKDETILNVIQNHTAHANSNTIHEHKKVNTITSWSNNQEVSIDIPLPLGLPLRDISGFELVPEDIGDALQLLEFCAVFGKALNVRKGEAEAVLRELKRARAGRLAQSFASSVVQFHVKLISVILKDKGKMSQSLNTNSGMDAWVKALNNLISGSDQSQLGLGALDKVIDYHNLEFAKKLRLLNFLCDEALATKKIRNWINDQNMKFIEQVKKERSVVHAARYEEKRLKQKMVDEVALAMLSKNAPLSIQEHDALVSKIKIEVALSHDQMIEAKHKLSNRSQISDAIRIEPVFSDGHDRRFWKLKYYGDEDAILLQDMRESVERWSSYGAEQKNDIRLYISSSRMNRQRSHGFAHPFSN